jgi:hypothetical protein
MRDSTIERVGIGERDLDGHVYAYIGLVLRILCDPMGVEVAIPGEGIEPAFYIIGQLFELGCILRAAGDLQHLGQVAALQNEVGVVAVEDAKLTLAQVDHEDASPKSLLVVGDVVPGVDGEAAMHELIFL